MTPINPARAKTGEPRSMISFRAGADLIIRTPRRRATSSAGTLLDVTAKRPA
jgi:hypothetical protein